MMSYKMTIIYSVFDLITPGIFTSIAEACAWVNLSSSSLYPSIWCVGTLAYLTFVLLHVLCI